MKHKTIFATLMLILLMTVIFFFSQCQGNAKGTKAANFTVRSTDGGVISLSNYKGKVVILDFWATWCPPCRKEIPGFVRLYEKYKNKELVIIGISVDQNGPSAVLPFIKNNGIQYPIGYATREVVEAYGNIRSIPTTFIIDKKGYIRNTFVGYRTEKVFEEILKELL